MRRMLLALVASLALAVAACDQGGQTGLTFDPEMTEPALTDPLATPGMTGEGMSPTPYP